MKTKLVGFFALAIMSFTSYAQEAKKCTLSHSFGFNLGSTTGTGLSYLMHVNKVYGFQLTASPYIYNENQQKLNFGFAGLYKIRDREKVDFLTYVGVNYIYTRGYSSTGIFDSYYYYGQIPNINQVNIGSGIGFEMESKDFSLKILGGFGAYSKTTAADNTVWRVLPAGEISLFYNL